MSRAAPLIAVAVISVALTACSFGTSKIDDQVQRASASSPGNYRAQVVRARAFAAKAKAAAEAELAIYPLVALLGSPTQRDARAAQARLEKLIARPATGSTEEAATTKIKETGVGRVRGASPEPRQGKAEPLPRTTVAVLTEPTQPTAAPKPPRTPLPPPRPAITARVVEAIVYDVETGIKTVHMSDGSVEENLFDPTELPSNDSSAAPGKPRVTIVNRGPASTEPNADPAKKAADEVTE